MKGIFKLHPIWKLSVCYFVFLLFCQHLHAQTEPLLTKEHIQSKKEVVLHNGHAIHVNIYENTDKPPIILMHGFPDNTMLYDLLVPKLINDFEVITFDFLGWGNSDKPKNYNYTSENQKRELNTVIEKLNIVNPILVAHDASGPPAIDWAIENEEKVNKLVLLNTYYSEMKSIKAPEAIWLFSTPVVREISKFFGGGRNNFIFHSVYKWQVGKFFRDEDTRDKFVPQLNAQFKSKKSTQRPFFKLNKDLNTTLKRGTSNLSKLKSFQKEVLIIFGEDDKYLNAGVGKEFHEIFPNSMIHLVEDARHFVQMDEPLKVAHLIISHNRKK